MYSKDCYGRWHGCVLSPPLRRTTNHSSLSDCRFWNGSLHIVNVVLVRVRRPSDPSATTGHWGHLHHHKSERNFRRNGTGDVEEREGFRQGDRVIRRHGVRHRVGEFYFLSRSDFMSLSLISFHQFAFISSRLHAFVRIFPSICFAVRRIFSHA